MSTPAELRTAFDRSGLWRIGMSYARALNNAAIKRALEAAANAARKREEQHHQPKQMGLI